MPPDAGRIGVVGGPAGGVGVAGGPAALAAGKSDRKNLSGSDGAAAAGVAPLAEAAAGEVACAAKRSEIRTAGVSGWAGGKCDMYISIQVRDLEYRCN